MNLRLIYKRLLGCHGPQGWWPIVNPRTLTSEYHMNAPRNGSDFFEIAVGAIMTQSVSWKNVDKAIAVLKKNKLLNPESILHIRIKTLAGMIRPTGYYNQKAKKIKNFIAWFSRHGCSYDALLRKDHAELRNELLAVNGIGPETADSILLYALNCKIFVVDAYTKRIFTRLGFFTVNEDYHGMQNIFHAGFRGTAQEFNEFHALIVAHGKNYCIRDPNCIDCCLSDLCSSKNSGPALS